MNVQIPDRPFVKALSRPSAALSWVSNNVTAPYVESVYTRRHARYPFTRDWDLFVILDACRYDLAHAHGPDGWGTPERVVSPGWDSESWIERTFGAASEEILSRTAVVSGNPFSPLLDPDSLAELDEVWTYAFDESIGTTPPRPITDRAIRLGRDESYDRILVHYMQPHLPACDEDDGIKMRPGGEGWRGVNPWIEIERGTRDPGDVVREYRGNLGPVVEDVKLLLENLDAGTAVISADHGNYLGEAGRWGHHDEFARHDAVRTVPWWSVSAEDRRTHSPQTYDKNQRTSREEQLAALGYVQ